MRVLIATEPGSPDRENEDWATATPDMVVVLDGATARLDTGCVHGIAWYANKLGGAIVTEAADHHKSLPDVLATAIRDVAALHPDCDLNHPGTPSAAVGILRRQNGSLDLLVLADVTIALSRVDGPVTVITDDRVDKIATAEREHALAYAADQPGRDDALKEMKRAQLALRNRRGGYFVAAADPDAAYQAYTETVRASEISEAAILTDGAAIAVTLLGLLNWQDLISFLASSGPSALLRNVKAAELSDSNLSRWPRMKVCDDATAAYVQL